MNDAKKFKLLLLASAGLVLLTLTYSVLEEFVMPGLEGYLQRKGYYERVISQKGLSLHKGLYWKEKR